MTKLQTILSAILLCSLPLSSQGLMAKKVQAPSFAAKIELIDRYHFDLSIAGPPMATKQQCLQYLQSKNPIPLLTIAPQELIDIFYEEALREGIRPDVAFAQSLHETGFFAYGGDVLPTQNNYSGLGTTGGGVKGAWFHLPRMGVRAQIQHLKAYTTTAIPTTEIVDPRYRLLQKTPSYGRMKTWQALNGKWAVPGITYGQTILSLHQGILAMH